MGKHRTFCVCVRTTNEKDSEDGNFFSVASQDENVLNMRGWMVLCVYASFIKILFSSLFSIFVRFRSLFWIGLGDFFSFFRFEGK